MKRFYKSAHVVPVENGCGVQLDDKPLRSPSRVEIVLPTQALAEAIVAEWNGQGDTVNVAAMPLTRLAYAAIDTVPTQRPAMTAQMLDYARSDLVCYRADAPAALVAQQAAAWNPLLQWLDDTYDAHLVITAGIGHVTQPPDAIAALEKALAARDPFVFTALHAAAAITGSLVIALALTARHINAAAAFDAGLIDETFQAEQWGRDAEAEARRARLKAELTTAAQFADLAA